MAGKIGKIAEISLIVEPNGAVLAIAKNMGYGGRFLQLFDAILPGTPGVTARAATDPAIKLAH